MVTEIVSSEIESVQGQVERILHSDEFRGSEVLRRLLRFLAEKSASGEADDLKEYTVAIEGLGKPFTYDPRHNSAVRIQVGRLRQKLADYYRTEGLEDPLIIDVPKGRFKLKCEVRAQAQSLRTDAHLDTSTPADSKSRYPEAPPAQVASGFSSRVLIMLLASAVIVLTGLCGYLWRRPVSTTRAAASRYPAGWTAELDALWQPFLSSGRPLMLVMEDPLFVEFKSASRIYFRDQTINSWEDLLASPNVAALRKSLGDPAVKPSRYYTAFGEVDASFLLTKLLGPRTQNLSVVKTSDLSLRQIGDNNVLFVGVGNLFFDQQKAMPVEVPFYQVREGIRNNNPKPDEPALFADQYVTAPDETGTAYALVTHLPGPLGDNDVESFTSSRAAGYVAAVKSFTDPDLERSIVGKLRESCGGHIPRYYQVLLKVKFKDNTPTEIDYVLGRELR